MSRVLRPVLMGAALVGVVATSSMASDEFAVPEPLRASLGWKLAPGENYNPWRDGSIFAVAAPPGQWPAARGQAEAWLATAPTLDENPAEHLLRKLAVVEAMMLSATDAQVATALREKRTELANDARRLREDKSKGSSDWRAKSAADQLVQLNRELGGWLADSPADRVRVFQEELEAHRPADRAQIAARYGGETRLAELIALVKEHGRLQAAHNAAQQDELSPELQRKQALRKAAGELGYFYGFHGQDEDLQRAMQDPDVLAAAGGGAAMDHRSVNVPDLVAWAGEAEAEKLLVEAFALPVAVQVDIDNRTGGLARRLLLDGKLMPARAPWSLVGWRGDVVDREGAKELAAMFDVLKNAFPDLTAKGAGGSDWNRNNGLATFAYALAIAGRMDEAVELLAAAGPDGSGMPYRARITQEAAGAAWDLVARAAATEESEHAWEQLVTLAGLAQRGEALADMAKKRAADAPKDSEMAKVWTARQAWALIGADQVDTGLALLVPVLDSRPAADDARWTTEWREGSARLLRLAKALGRSDLVRVQSERLTPDFQRPTGLVWRDGTLFEAFAAHQLKAGNFALLDEILRGRLAVKPKAPSSGGRMVQGGEVEGEGRMDRRQVTWQLADVLGRQGRHAEVVALMADSPDWGQADLAQALGQSGGGREWRSLALIAAESLHAVGRSDDATRILEAALIKNSGSDPLYGLYTRVLGAKAVPFLEKLWAADRYQERPLIWLASLQLAAGEVASAEKTIQLAIATDPSDGEQPKGDRMRAYAVLREVALKKGDEAQATFLADVVAAIRRSEDADDLAGAGLSARAIKEYQRALESFSDAYCIQSRLARELAEENRMAEAAEHYRRAFELMPDSFGRVESHCFGCEKAFAGEEAQSIAEQVFTEMAAKPDAKPQVYYLLGYLRMEQGRWDEAASHFTRAVEADPEYLNAWLKLAEVLPNTARPRSELDRAVFRLIALDPMGRRGSSAASSVRDLPALWNAYAQATDAGLVVPAKVYPLGDKAKKPGKPTRAGLHGMPDMDELEGRDAAETPAKRLAKHGVLRSVTQAMDTLYQWRTSPY